jgi:hypothetical protein
VLHDWPKKHSNHRPGIVERQRQLKEEIQQQGPHEEEEDHHLAGQFVKLVPFCAADLRLHSEDRVVVGLVLEPLE